MIGGKPSGLRTYRRSQGLCYCCGGKWSRDHRCPQAVQLHVLEEVLGVFFEDEPEAPVVLPDDEAVPEQAQLHAMLSVAAVTGVAEPRTMCFNSMGVSMRYLFVFC